MRSIQKQILTAILIIVVTAGCQQSGTEPEASRVDFDLLETPFADSAAVEHLLFIPPYVVFCSDGIKLYRSYTNGDSWEENTPAGKNIACLQKYDRRSVYAGTGQGLYRTADYGIHWQYLDTGLESVDNIVCIGSGTTAVSGYAGGSQAKRIRITTDGGATWRFGSPDGADYSVLFYFRRKGVLFASAEGNGIFRSTDMGSSWEYTGMSSHSVTDIGVNADSMLVLSDDTGLFSSTDTGHRWHSVSVPGDISVGKLLYVEPYALLAGTSDGIYSIDEAGGTLHYFALREHSVYGITASRGSYIYVSTDRGLFRSEELVEYYNTQTGWRCDR